MPQYRVVHTETFIYAAYVQAATPEAAMALWEQGLDTYRSGGYVDIVKPDDLALPATDGIYGWHYDPDVPADDSIVELFAIPEGAAEPPYGAKPLISA